MGINWGAFKQTIMRYNAAASAAGAGCPSSAQKAAAVTAAYVTAISTATDNMYGNVPIAYNPAALEGSLNAAYTACFATTTAIEVNAIMMQALTSGCIGFWTGAQLAMLIPPTGSFQVLTNPVIVPGVAVSYSHPLVTSNPTAEEEAIALATAFEIHLTQLTGLTTSLTPAGISIVPIPYPWVGLS
jgi:hypothetical protein